LRERQRKAARDMLMAVAPVRRIIEHRAERDARWLATFLGIGGAILALLRVDRLSVAVSSDPQRWPKHHDIEQELPLTRNVLETESTFVIPDMRSLLPQSDSIAARHRFVAAVPLLYRNVPIGVGCIVDDQPRVLDTSDLTLIQALCTLLTHTLFSPTEAIQEAPLIGRPAFEIVVRTEFDRAARLGLTVHLFVFSSSTPPPELIAERTLVADLGAGHFGMTLTRRSSERSQAELVAAVRRLIAAPGFVGGDLFSIEVGALPRLDAEDILRRAERRLDERLAVAGKTHPVMHVVVHEEALSGLPETALHGAGAPA
jgi:hypothetical protein